MSKYWKIFIVITCLLSVVAILNSFFNINIKTIDVEGANMIGWITVILEVSVAVIAILFAYNVISFEKRVKEKIQETEKKLKKEFSSTIKTLENEFLVSIYLLLGQTYSSIGKHFDAVHYYLEFLRLAPKDFIMNEWNKKGTVTIKQELEKLRTTQKIPSPLKKEWLKILYRMIDIDTIDTEGLIASVNLLGTFEITNENDTQKIPS